MAYITQGQLLLIQSGGCGKLRLLWLRCLGGRWGWPRLSSGYRRGGRRWLGLGWHWRRLRLRQRWVGDDGECGQLVDGERGGLRIRDAGQRHQQQVPVLPRETRIEQRLSRTADPQREILHPRA